jgi:hypothetical protein
MERRNRRGQVAVLYRYTDVSVHRPYTYYQSLFDELRTELLETTKDNNISKAKLTKRPMLLSELFTVYLLLEREDAGSEHSVSSP